MRLATLVFFPLAALLAVLPVSAQQNKAECTRIAAEVYVAAIATIEH